MSQVASVSHRRRDRVSPARETHRGELHNRGVRFRFGLTLIELVVVLAILAAVTTAASVATERVLLQKRSELTMQTLDAFRRSLLGSYGQGESISTVSSQGGPPAIDGFIADMGRLPVAAGLDPATQLAELWLQPPGVAAYGPQVAPGDPEVTLACGWRGPYLELPIGGNRLIDGFGRGMLVLTRDAAGQPRPATDGETVLGLTSLGSDGQLGVTGELPLAEDLSVWLGQTPASYSPGVTVRVFEADGGGGLITPSQAGSLMVRLYLPDGASGGVTFQQSAMISTPATASFNFPNVPIGQRVLRAYWVSEDGTASVNSAVTPIEVRRGGRTQFELVLPQLPVEP